MLRVTLKELDLSFVITNAHELLLCEVIDAYIYTGLRLTLPLKKKKSHECIRSVSLLQNNYTVGISYFSKKRNACKKKKKEPQLSLMSKKDQGSKASKT